MSARTCLERTSLSLPDLRADKLGSAGHGQGPRRGERQPLALVKVRELEDTARGTENKEFGGQGQHRHDEVLASGGKSVSDDSRACPPTCTC